MSLQGYDTRYKLQSKRADALIQRYIARYMSIRCINIAILSKPTRSCRSRHENSPPSQTTQELHRSQALVLEPQQNFCNTMAEQNRLICRDSKHIKFDRQAFDLRMVLYCIVGSSPTRRRWLLYFGDFSHQSTTRHLH